jgi:hypothetical protein
MIARMTSAFPSGLVRVLGRSVLASALASVLLCAPAGAQTIGYLYTAIGGGVAQFAVNADTSLTYEGLVSGGPSTVDFPGSLVMAKTADGENLYQLAGTGTTETIYQYSVSPSTGALTAKDPDVVGSVPLLASEERRFMAVYNPADSGAGGQNALYVLSGPNTESAKIYMFDIDATTGALTQADEIPIPGMRFGEALAYSGDVLAVTGSTTSFDEGFQRAVIDPSSGIPEFESLPDAPCPGHSCDDGQLYMLDSEHMLSANLILNPNNKLVEEYVAGVSAYEVGGSWGSLGSSATVRPGPGEITANGHEYFTLEQQSEFEALDNEEPFTGEALFEAFSPDGLSEGHTRLPSSTVVGPTGIFALGSGLYIANQGVHGFSTGGAYRLSSNQPPVSTELDQTLGDAMTGFLIAGSEGTGAGGGTEGPGPGGPGSGSAETPAAGSGTTPSAGSGSSETPAAGAAGAQIKGAGAVVKAISLSGSGSAKLGSGVIKLDVTCGLPCTVSGFVLPPGAKAASAHKKPKALPFKSIRLAGSGEPVLVTLRFTPAQKKLATALLRKHEKVTANITVTEAPGGASPQSTSIKIT